MELIRSDDFYILQHVQKGESNLWISRHTGQWEVRPSWDLAGQENLECLGLVWALYGKLSIHPDLPERLVLVKHCDRVAELPGGPHSPNSLQGNQPYHAVYRVTGAVMVPLLPPGAIEPDPAGTFGLKPCPKHHPGAINHPDFEPTTSAGPDSSSGGQVTAKPLGVPFGKITGSLKSMATDTIKSTAGNLAANLEVKSNAASTGTGAAGTASSRKSVSKVLERYERRINDELNKLFNESQSLYFSLTGDITNSLQRQLMTTPPNPNHPHNWLSNVDDRFFFNKSMVQDLIDLNDTRSHAWVTPFIQGFVETQNCNIAEENSSTSDPGGGGDVLRHSPELPSHYRLAIISRRSRFRAGTRYKRRGVDTEGHVANYVETEQILMYHHYCLAFIQVRGSVPIHWSQPGYKYRPPPRLDRTPEEDQQSFMRHFSTEMAVYGPPIHCVNLAEKNGRERIITEAYLDQALWYNNPDLTFVSFDFHEHCRGMHFENVAVLTDAIEETLRNMRYTWLDRHGLVCTQVGVFRVNCIDCLDRTNVVQTSIARLVLENQLTKLGVSGPEQPLHDETRRVFQILWANNGDALSRQYAGTNALKGDFTRTGERNLSGLMKDGMNSASRYYLNQFRDAYRQATIDLVTGQLVGDTLMGTNVEDIEKGEEEAEEEFDSSKAEQVKLVIDDCQRLLIPDLSSIIGCWGLIDSDAVTGDPSQEDMDVIFILTRDSYYVANYDDDVDKVTRYQCVSYFDIESIEFGTLEESALSQLGFRSKASAKNEHHLRISYKMPGPPVVTFSEEHGSAVLTPGAPVSGYFHMFRSTNLRFFNNMTFPIRSDEERQENLNSVAESLAMAIEMATGGASGVDVIYAPKLSKRRSKIPDLNSNFNGAGSGGSGAHPGAGGANRQPNLAVQALKGSGKALFNVTSHLTSKLNPLAKIKQSQPNSDATCSPTHQPLGHTSSCDLSQPQQQQPPTLSTSTLIPGLQEPEKTRRVLPLIPGLSGGPAAPTQAPSAAGVIFGSSSPIPQRRNPAATATGAAGAFRQRQLSKSSEDIAFSPVPGDELIGGSSEQSPVATAAASSATSTPKFPEALNPFSKLTKGLQSVVKRSAAREQPQDSVVPVSDFGLDSSSDSQQQVPRSASMDYMQGKVNEACSHTKVILL